MNSVVPTTELSIETLNIKFMLHKWKRITVEKSFLKVECRRNWVIEMHKLQALPKSEISEVVIVNKLMNLVSRSFVCSLPSR